MDQIFFEGWGGLGFGKFLRHDFFVTLEGEKVGKACAIIIILILKGQTEDLNNRKCLLNFFHCGFPYTLIFVFNRLGSTGVVFGKLLKPPLPNPN